MRGQTACFSGHREIAHDTKLPLKRGLYSHCEELIKRNYKYFGLGGAIGFDYLAFTVLWELKIKYPKIRIILVIPCRDYFYRFWNEGCDAAYEKMLQKADKVVYISDKYTATCIRERNQHLINHSSALVYYMTNPISGTGQTYRMAARADLELLYVLKY